VAHYGSGRRRDERLPAQVTIEPRPDSRLTLGGDYSYQRVDGSAFWLTARYTSSLAWVPELSTRFGYGYESKHWTIETDFAQPLLPSRTLAAGVYYLDGTGYENQSGIGWRENTLAALLFKHDFNDYYDIQAIEPYVRVRLPGGSTLRVSYAVEDYDSLVTQTDWSLFEVGRERFRPNPPLFLLNDPAGLGGSGRLRATRVELVHDSRRARQVGTVGSFVRGFLEIGDGDFSYARWVADSRAYMRLGPPVHMAARFAAGGRFGNDAIPSQKLFYVGGLGTVRGHEFRSLYGDYALVGGAEYTLLFRDLKYGALLFYDVGTAWNSTQQALGDATLLQSLGFGLKTADNDFQIHFAKPVGGVEGDLETMVRLQRTF
jgi:outer membrane translocation and assembly module TamA